MGVENGVKVRNKEERIKITTHCGYQGRVFSFYPVSLLAALSGLVSVLYFDWYIISQGIKDPDRAILIVVGCLFVCLFVHLFVCSFVITFLSPTLETEPLKI